VNTQAGIKVFYQGMLINESEGYMLIDNKIILKIKTAGCLKKEDEAELSDYLKAANSDVGILLNFGTKPEFTLTMHNNFQRS
jgi:GxxExxY protein